MAERDLIARIRELAARDMPAWLRVGIGDDAAVVDPPHGGRLVITTDMVVEGVHFEAGTPPEQIGHKAIARGLSDIAAMAARPLCTVAAVDFGSKADGDWCAALCRSLWQSAATLSAPLIGGDIASGRGALNVTVTALGTPGPRGVVTRAGAQPGDAVCVTGWLGGSILGRHLTFQPRIAEAVMLVEQHEVHALIDISDGLSTDARHISEASGVGITLWGEAIPIAEDAVVLAGRTGREPLAHALNDGEDYELLFCLPAAGARRLAEAGLGDLPVAVIGEVTSEEECRVLMPDGRREPLRAEGWEHLSP